MESMSREFALFIDGIRIERGISRLDLIDDNTKDILEELPPFLTI
jgi:hypothetical protein